MTHTPTPTRHRPSNNLASLRKGGSAEKPTSLEGLRPLVNQLNQYFEKTRHSPAPSQIQ